ncbi:MAG: prolyl oligopeptidase family serine peptidase, partial [bacterium]
MHRSLVVLASLAACGGKPPPRPASTERAPEARAPAPTEPPPAAPHTDYPESRREDIVDRIHGTEVRDPYRWLEDPTKPEVQAWMKAQDEYARSRLAKLPGRDAFAARLRELFYRDEVGPPSHRGTRFFYGRRHKDKEKVVTYWKQGENGAERVLLDPNTWSEDGSKGLRGSSVSWDGKYVAYQVSEHNADETVMKVSEVATGKVLPDTVAGVKFGGASWAPDGRGFYYTWTPPASDKLTESARSGQSEMRYHKLGGDPAKDTVVHEATGHVGWFLSGRISQDGHWLFASIRRGSSGQTSWFYKDTRKPQKAWTTLVDGLDAQFNVVDWRDRFYVYTNDGAPRFHVLEVDPKRPARAAWKEIIAEQDATMEGVQIIGGHLIVSYLRDVASEMEVRSLDGKLVRKIDLPPLGSATGMTGRPDEDTAYFGFESFTEIDTIYKTSIRTGKVAEWTRVSMPVDASMIAAEQVRFKSKDGTEIPMFLIHRKDAAKNGKTPTLLTGYGGFRISLTPTFNAVYDVILEHGGMVAIPS